MVSVLGICFEVYEIGVVGVFGELGCFCGCLEVVFWGFVWFGIRFFFGLLFDGLGLKLFM